MQRAEAGAAALRLREPDHHEVGDALGAQLQPVGRAPGPVRRVGALRDQPFELEPADFPVEGLALLGDVIDVAYRPGARQQLLQQALPLHERQRAQVEALERDQVERIQRRGQLECRALDVGGAALLGPPLQPLEARAALRVEHDDLAVDHQVTERQRRERAGDVGIDGDGVAALAVLQMRRAALARRQHAVAVVLQLEDPSRVAERLLRRLGQHQLDRGRAQLSPRRREPLELGLQLARARGPGADLLEREARVDRLRRQGARGARPAVVALDQHPLLALVLAAPLDAEQVPGAAQLVAEELEAQLAERQGLVRILGRDPEPLVPDDHLAGAVVALGDDTLEVGVLHRVVLDLHREALVGGVERGAHRHRPRAQHAAELEPEVVVKARGGVLLDAEEARPRPGGASLRGGD